MPKARTRIEDLRRGELIAAAHRVFLGHGLAGLTTARICAEAGMSAGILSYYFRGKDEVLFAMVRHNNRLLAQDVVARLRAAATPWDRLRAIAGGNFPPDAYQPNVAAAWLSVCAAASTTPQFARLQRIFYRRLASNVSAALAGHLAPPRQAGIALAVGAMIDGLWLRKATGAALDAPAATAAVMEVIAGLLTPQEVQRLSAG
jgi:TetR/AcrR family transcriptional regulator, transcriptional repressor of bet genes